MLHVGDGYLGALAVHSMGEWERGGVIHTQITWCFKSFDLFIAAYLLYSLVTSESEGVHVGHCKLYPVSSLTFRSSFQRISPNLL